MKSPQFELHWTGILSGIIALHGIQNVLGAPISFSRVGPELVLGWPAGASLEEAPRPDGPWTAVATTGTSHRIRTDVGRRYFRARDGQLLTVSRTGTGGGTVTSNPTGLDCPAACSRTWSQGTQVVLKAAASPGSRFVGWNGDCTGTGDCTVTMNAPRNIEARFDTDTQAESVVNGGFELGPLSGWAQEPGQLIFPASQVGAAAVEGQYVARLGFDSDGRRLARIGQRMTLPQRQPLYLNFWALVYSEELCDVPYYDNITIFVNSTKVYEDDRVCRGSDTGGWVKSSIDLTALAGQVITLVFQISSADSLTSILLLDGLELSDRSVVQ